MSGSRKKTRKVTKKNTTRKNTRSVSSVAKRIKKNAEENSVFADISEDFFGNSLNKNEPISSILNHNSFSLKMPLDDKNEEKHSDVIKQTMQYEKKIYDLEQLLDIAGSFCSTLDFVKLLESIVYICMAQMHVLGAEIFTRDIVADDVMVLATANISEKKAGMVDIEKDDAAARIAIPYNSSVTEYLLECQKPVTFKELSENTDDDKTLLILAGLSPTLVVPLIQKRHLNGILILQERIAIDNDTSYSEYEQSQIMSIASLASVAIYNASLLEMSSIDMMTHLKLKYYFFNMLTEKIETAVSKSQNLAVIMFDIDLFKKFNDTFGHDCGDFVLVSVAKLIKENLRDLDVASRYGGEEFTVYLDNTGTEEAVLVAERIRKTIEEYEFKYNGTSLHVTISGGVTVFDKKTNPETITTKLVNQADKALYVSKRNGRNRISLYDSSLPEYAE